MNEKMKQIKDETLENVIDLLRACITPTASMNILDTALLARRIHHTVLTLENADPVPDLELLRDPTAVLTMILRGTIAKPDGMLFYEEWSEKEKELARLRAFINELADSPCVAPMGEYAAGHDEIACYLECVACKARIYNIEYPHKSSEINHDKT
jgi:hypothetical protein